MVTLAMSGSPAARPPVAAELDRATLERARRGDALALQAFVVRYERPVFALLSRLLGPGPHVEDLAQDTFLRAIRAIGAFDPNGAARPSTWLLTIATRLALDARKRKRVPLVSIDAQVRSLPDPATPETERSRRELGRRIAAAAAELDDDQRAAFVLAEIHGLTMAEIGAALGVPEGTAKTRLYRARQHMRERLSSFTQEDDDGDV